jgi:uncharacterized protein YbaR (Trm112 family)
MADVFEIKECPNCHKNVFLGAMYTTKEGTKEYALCNECGQWFEITKEG